MMKTTFKEEGKDLVMYFEGRLDTSAAAQTEREMQVLYIAMVMMSFLTAHNLSISLQVVCASSSVC